MLNYYNSVSSLSHAGHIAALLSPTCAEAVLSTHTNSGRRLASNVQKTRQRTDPSALALWQQVAGLTADQAQQLLQQQPQLSNFLHAGFSGSDFAHNLHLLRCLGGDFKAGVPAKLRAYLALAPHHALQQVKQQIEQVLAGQAVQQLLHLQPQQQAFPVVQQQQQASVTEQLTTLLEARIAHAGHRWRVKLQKQQQQQQQQQQRQQQQQLQQQEKQMQLLLPHKQQPEQQQAPLQQVPQLWPLQAIQRVYENKIEQLRGYLAGHSQLQQLDGSYLELADAVIKALGLRGFEQLPYDKLPKALNRTAPASNSSTAGTDAVLGSCDGFNTSSSSDSSGYHSTSSQTCSSGSRRKTSSTASVLTKEQQHTTFSCLCAVLAITSRSLSLRSKPILDPAEARTLIRQLKRHSSMSEWELLKLLLDRPLLFWSQHKPGPLLAHLQKQLPSLPIKQLLQRAPGLLSLPESQVSEVLALLLGRLALSREQAAGVVLRNPRVLLGGPRPAFMNLGFLVGLGVRPPELQAMLLKSSAWLTRPLKDLTMQWQFVTTAAKASLSDVVLLPQLLSMPISRLAPRILYARKRQVKLLLPSHAAMLPALSQTEWLKHKLVPLEFWITATDKRMCEMVALSVDDYSRFKAAWARVDAFSWSQTTGTEKPK